MATILVKQIVPPADLATSNVCVRRRFIDIDRDLQQMRFLVAPALEELADVPNIPPPYVDFIRRYAASGYPRYRVSAVATALCLATAVLTP